MKNKCFTQVLYLSCFAANHFEVKNLCNRVCNDVSKCHHFLDNNIRHSSMNLSGWLWWKCIEQLLKKCLLGLTDWAAEICLRSTVSAPVHRGQTVKRWKLVILVIGWYNEYINTAGDWTVPHDVAAIRLVGQMPLSNNYGTLKNRWRKSDI